MAEEDGKPNADRLREYRQSNRESLEQMLFSAAPIYDDLETLKLADGLSMFVTEAGAEQRPGREGARRQVAARSGRRTDPRIAIEGRGRAAGAGQGRQGGDRGLGRPDDPTGAARGRPRAEGPPHEGATSRRAVAAGLREDRQGPLRRVGHRGLPGRHVHAPPGLRRGERLRRIGPAPAALDDPRRGLRACGRTQQSRTVQPAPALARGQGPT